MQFGWRGNGNDDGWWIQDEMIMDWRKGWWIEGKRQSSYL